MRTFRLPVLFALLSAAAAPGGALAVGPTVNFTLPHENETPAPFGAVPFPNDLYFDGGQPADGDGTLLDGASGAIGLATDVLRANAASVEDALDLLDGFGTTTAAFFFFSGPIDVASLPASPVTSPSVDDAVFCAEAATATPVPIALKFDVDPRVPNVLAVLPLPGRPLKPRTTYACVVRRSVTGGGEAVQPSADWVEVRDGTSDNSDADAIYDPVVTRLGADGVVASDIAGMTVFTTQSTTDDLVSINATVLPGLPVPTADFTSLPDLVFDTPERVTLLLGSGGHDHIAMVATGYYESPRFTTHDPDGDGPLGDLPNPNDPAVCPVPCETTDERFTHDAGGLPVVIDVPEIPFTLVVPAGTPPANGWPVIIQQHGLGGQRDTVVQFGEVDAAAGFASIGIDASGHGYRYFDCKPAARCSQDNANNMGGTAVPDGFADGSFAGQSVGFLSVNLGFFEAFHNFLAVRDHFRQTYADLLSLVRLLQGGSIDTALGTRLDAARIFYMGHSLGGLMGSGFVPIEPDLSAALLNATGGGLTNQLFVNSSIGAGALALVEQILGLDPATPFDQFAISSNLTQLVLDPADGINSARLLLDPAAGSARNVLQVVDFGDQVVPNQASEALALAAGLPLLEPFVQNLHQSALSLPLVSPPRTIHANAAGGTATAALLQNGPATHAQSIITLPGTLTFVPEFGHVDDFVRTGNGFPALERGIRVPNAGILDAVIAWFRDVVTNGTPGTFTFDGEANFNPIQNLDVPAGASVERFFARTVGEGGTLAGPEPTPDVEVEFTANTMPTRLTAARSILGTSAFAADADVPPGPAVTVGTAGFLPFFVTLQRQIEGTFSADVTIAYTTAELEAAGIAAGSADEAALVVGRFVPGTCTMGGASCAEDRECGANGPCVGAAYEPFLNSVVDTTAHTVRAPGLTDFSTFAVMASSTLATALAGGGSARTDCRAVWQVLNPTGVAQVPRRGRPEQVPTCQDGDPRCDRDGAADGTCTFRVGLCFNATAETCEARPVKRYELVSPTPRDRDAVKRANAQALLEALVAFGGQRRNSRRSAVKFAPALDGGCTPVADFRVAVGPRGAVLRGAAKARGPLDTDRLRLRCDAAAP